VESREMQSRNPVTVQRPDAFGELGGTQDMVDIPPRNEFKVGTTVRHRFPKCKGGVSCSRSECVFTVVKYVAAKNSPVGNVGASKSHVAVVLKRSDTNDDLMAYMYENVQGAYAVAGHCNVHYWLPPMCSMVFP